MNHVLPLTKHQACQRIITCSLKSTNGINWPKEIKMAQKILADFPYLWRCPESVFRAGLFTLAWYLTKEGLKYLKQHEPVDIEFKVTEYKLEQNLIGENYVPNENNKKPKNIKEFLK